MLTLNRKKPRQFFEAKHWRNLTDINQNDCTKIIEVKQTHSSQAHIQNFCHSDFTILGSLNIKVDSFVQIIVKSYNP